MAVEKKRGWVVKNYALILPSETLCRCRYPTTILTTLPGESIITATMTEF